MDTITHGLSGALLARTMKIKNVKPKTFLLVGFFSGIFPDFDFLFSLISPTAYLLNHRGITHSFFFLPVWAFLISLFFSWMLKNKIFFKDNWINEGVTQKILIKELWLLSCGAILLHVLGDIITQFGTMFLSPFSNKRFETGSVFIIDLVFSSILIAGIALSFLSKKYQKIIASLCFLMWFGYIGYTHHMKTKAENIAIDYLISQQITDVKIYSSPRPVSAKNWSISALDKETQIYHLIDFSLDKDKIISHDYRNQNFIELLNNMYPPYHNAIWQKIPKWGKNEQETQLAHKIWNDELFKNYRWFYEIVIFDFMTNKENKVCGYFRDLRFSGSGRENGTPFVYGICYSDNNKQLVQFKNGKSEILN